MKKSHNDRALPWLLVLLAPVLVMAAEPEGGDNATPAKTRPLPGSMDDGRPEDIARPDPHADDFDPRLPSWGHYSIERLTPAHDSVSRWVDNTARNIDNFFGTEESYRVNNDSYMRVSQEFNWEESEGFSQDIGFRFRLDLPTAQDKLRIIFESDPEESEGTLSEQGAGTIRRTQPERRQSVLGLGRFLGRDKRERWDANVNAGIRVRWPLDPYVRVTAERLWRVSGPWMLESNNRVSWFEGDGYFARTRWDIGRPFGHRDHLRFITNMQWREKEDQLEFSEAVEWNRILGPRSVIRYAGVAVGRSASSPRMEDYFLLMDYRRNLHREILFLDLVPELHFPREANYDPRWMFTVRLEVYFRANIAQRDWRVSAFDHRSKESPWAQQVARAEHSGQIGLSPYTDSTYP